MRYHNITHDDMLNGDGLRVVLWLSGCEHYCEGCHNSITWDCNRGLIFDDAAKSEIFKELDKDYISGITFSGGDPLHDINLHGVYTLCEEIKGKFPTKTIWLYTGYTWEYIFDTVNAVDIIGNQARREILKECDVIVDGRFIKELADVNYRWAGSTNQRVIDVKESLKTQSVVLH